MIHIGAQNTEQGVGKRSVLGKIAEAKEKTYEMCLKSTRRLVWKACCGEYQKAWEEWEREKGRKLTDCENLILEAWKQESASRQKHISWVLEEHK